MPLVIEQERIKREWTKKYIADKIGKSKSAVTQIFNGKIKPCYDVLVKLENLFEMRHTELFKEITADGTNVKRLKEN